MTSNEVAPPPLPPRDRTEFRFQVEADQGHIYYSGYDRAKADAAFQKAIDACEASVTYRVHKYVYGNGGGAKQD